MKDRFLLGIGAGVGGDVGSAVGDDVGCVGSAVGDCVGTSKKQTISKTYIFSISSTIFATETVVNISLRCAYIDYCF